MSGPGSILSTAGDCNPLSLPGRGILELTRRELSSMKQSARLPARA